uniref:Uncharacterized protein n=1 Tax=Setaria viridis TaxID=4556 RepID=A0A4U6VKA8_SETVI|nr:hypothetical protein SEVIR_2G012400v2 [Setaria viridis]
MARVSTSPRRRGPRSPPRLSIRAGSATSMDCGKRSLPAVKNLNFQALLYCEKAKF